MKLNKRSLFRILGGIVLYLFFLEILAWTGGVAYLKYQDFINKRSISQNGEFKILCLGESTTASQREDSYVRQLEKILNAQTQGVKFAVINKGIPGITTRGILERLDGFINAYQPDMVVSMIGINDSNDADDSLLASHGKGKKEPWVQKIHIVKLINTLIKHVQKTKEGMKEEPISIEEQNRLKLLSDVKQRAVESNTSKGYMVAAAFFRASNDVSVQKELLDLSLALDPNNVEAISLLAEYYKRLGEYKAAIEAFERLMKITKDGEYLNFAMDNLGQIYELMGDDQKAEVIYIQILNIMPKHPKIWCSLAGVYFLRHEYDKAIALYEKQLQVNPQYNICYGILASLYHAKGQDQKALQILLSGIQVLPNDTEVNRDLGFFLIQNGQYEQGLEFLKKTIKLNPQSVGSINLHEDSVLLSKYDQMTKAKIIRQWQSVSGVKDVLLNSETAQNYQKLSSRLQEQHIPLIVVQYPMRSVEPLKKVLFQRTGVIFVENKKNFMQAMSQGKYEDYFLDHFAGDFGHCTAKGNFILASHVAQEILRYLAVKDKRF